MESFLRQHITEDLLVLVKTAIEQQRHTPTGAAAAPSIRSGFNEVFIPPPQLEEVEAALRSTAHEELQQQVRKEEEGTGLTSVAHEGLPASRTGTRSPGRLPTTLYLQVLAVENVALPALQRCRALAPSHYLFTAAGASVGGGGVASSFAGTESGEAVGNEPQNNSEVDSTLQACETIQSMKEGHLHPPSSRNTVSSRCLKLLLTDGYRFISAVERCCPATCAIPDESSSSPASTASTPHTRGATENRMPTRPLLPEGVPLGAKLEIQLVPPDDPSSSTPSWGERIRRAGVWQFLSDTSSNAAPSSLSFYPDEVKGEEAKYFRKSAAAVLRLDGHNTRMLLPSDASASAASVHEMGGVAALRVLWEKVAAEYLRVRTGKPSALAANPNPFLCSSPPSLPSATEGVAARGGSTSESNDLQHQPADSPTGSAIVIPNGNDTTTSCLGSSRKRDRHGTDAAPSPMSPPPPSSSFIVQPSVAAAPTPATAISRSSSGEEATVRRVARSTHSVPHLGLRVWMVQVLEYVSPPTSTAVLAPFPFLFQTSGDIRDVLSELQLVPPSTRKAITTTRAGPTPSDGDTQAEEGDVTYSLVVLLGDPTPGEAMNHSMSSSSHSTLSLSYGSSQHTDINEHGRVRPPPHWNVMEGTLPVELGNQLLVELIGVPACGFQGISTLLEVTEALTSASGREVQDAASSPLLGKSNEDLVELAMQTQAELLSAFPAVFTSALFPPLPSSPTLYTAYYVELRTRLAEWLERTVSSVGRALESFGTRSFLLRWIPSDGITSSSSSPIHPREKLQQELWSSRSVGGSRLGGVVLEVKQVLCSSTPTSRNSMNNINTIE